MEFLGDSVLDMVIVDKLFRHEKRLSHVDMHLYKSATVTADFLAFVCLDLSMQVGDVTADTDLGSGKTEMVKGVKEVPFWRFLRHNSLEVSKAQAHASKNYASLKGVIVEQLWQGESYPWCKLAELDAEKLFSDMVESVLGAVFIDSRGSWDEVRKVAGKFGITTVLERLLEDNVDPRHPKSKLGVYVAGKMEMGTVRYVTGVEGGRYWGAVLVNKRELCRVGGGRSREEVRGKAAEGAYWKLVQELGPEGKGENEIKWMVEGGEEEGVVENWKVAMEKGSPVGGGLSAVGAGRV